MLKNPQDFLPGIFYFDKKSCFRENVLPDAKALAFGYLRQARSGLKPVVVPGKPIQVSVSPPGGYLIFGQAYPPDFIHPVER